MSDDLGALPDLPGALTTDQAIVRSMYPEAKAKRRTSRGWVKPWQIRVGLDQLSGWCETEAAAWKAAVRRVRAERAKKEGKG